MSEQARDYWDRIGHKGKCPVWGDEEMICSCTCGPRPANTQYSSIKGRGLKHPLQNVPQAMLDRAYAKLVTATEDGSIDLYDRKDVEAVAHSVLATAFEEGAVPQTEVTTTYEEGRRDAIRALAHFIYNGYIGLSGHGVDQIAVWFVHVADMALLPHGTPTCQCDIASDYDNSYDMQWCAWYSDEKNRRRLYLDWVGMTEEELQAKERAAAEEAARKKQEQEERTREYRRKQLHELAEEFGVDPRLLP